MSSLTPNERNITFKQFSSPKKVIGDKYSQKVVENCDVDCDSTSVDSYNGENFELFLLDLDNENRAIPSDLECSADRCDDTFDEEISKLESTLLDLEEEGSLSDEDKKLVLDTTVIKLNCKSKLAGMEQFEENDLLNEESNDSKGSVPSEIEKEYCSTKLHSAGHQCIANSKTQDSEDDEMLLDDLSTLSNEPEDLRNECSLPNSSEVCNLNEEGNDPNQSNCLNGNGSNELKLAVTDVCETVGSNHMSQHEGTLLPSVPSSNKNSEHFPPSPSSNFRTAEMKSSSIPCITIDSGTSSSESSLSDDEYIIIDECEDISEDESTHTQTKSALQGISDLPLSTKDNCAKQLPSSELNETADAKLSVESEAESLGSCNLGSNISEAKNIFVKDISSKADGIPSDAGEKLKSENKEPGEENKQEVVYVETVIQPADEDFVSNDPLENADNNNPEWEFLRKLETDEERYKAMRKRWRSLVIPDPNQNLTYLHCKFKRNKGNGTTVPFHVLKKCETPTKTSKNCKRKRNNTTDPPSSNNENPAKRLRTQSCTSVFDRKVEELQKSVENKKQQLWVEEQAAMENLGAQQSVEQFQLLNSHINPWRLNILRNQLFQRQREDFEQLRERYTHALKSAEVEVKSKMDAIRKATEEVRAFHSFYQGLDSEDTSKDCLLLTDTELEDILEYERLDEKYKIFYK